MNGKRDEKIRSRAYGIWEREGRPHGRQEHHWHQAIREVDDENSDAEAGAEQPHSNADARLTSDQPPVSSETPAGSGLPGKTAAPAKRPRAPKPPAQPKATAKPKAPAKPKA